jgi:glutamate racemase
VVACNTATGVAVDDLRAMFDVPIVAVEPAVKPAASRTRTAVVGVLTTTGTALSEKLTRLVSKYGTDVRMIVQPSPGLADQVEKGELGTDETRALVKTYVQPLIDKGADVIVLGCTHYPLIRSVIQDIAGPKVELIDPADAVARELRRRLTEAGLANVAAETVRGRTSDRGTERFFTTGDPNTVAQIIGTLWGSPVTVIKEQI